MVRSVCCELQILTGGDVRTICFDYIYTYSIYSACEALLKGNVFEAWPRGLLRIALFIYSRSPQKSCPKAALFRPGIKPVKAKVKGCRFRRYGNECCSNEPCLPYAFDLSTRVQHGLFSVGPPLLSIVPSKRRLLSAANLLYKDRNKESCRNIVKYYNYFFFEINQLITFYRVILLLELQQELNSLQLRKLIIFHRSKIKSAISRK